jgi:hypothetical protein
VCTVRIAPRVHYKLRRELERHYRDDVPIAEINRRIGALADRIGAPRPSYEQIRTLVHELRESRAQPTTASVAFDVATRVRPPTALVDHLSGVGVPRKPYRK